MKSITAAILAGVAMATAAAGAANAVPVTSSLAITYYQVPHGSDPDFPGSNPTVANGSSLGANGLPVGSGVADLTSGGEITWWSPALNSHVSQTGAGVVNLPYGSNMFAPNSTGSNNTDYFETAALHGLFSLATSSTVTFALGSDDDSFIYVDGKLFGQNPGIHGTTTVNFTTPALDAGSHTLDIFYADRQNTQAYLSLDVTSEGVTITPGAPEPSTWLLMIAGVGGIGYALRRQRRGGLEKTAAQAA